MTKHSEVARPLPIPDIVSEEWWKACKKHELLLQKCSGCGALRFPPRPMCSKCQSTKMGWIKASGKGKVYTYTIVVQPTHPYFATKVPYDIVLVELAEGPRILGNMVNCPHSEIKVGMPVKVVFEDVSQDIALPMFKRIE